MLFDIQFQYLFQAQDLFSLYLKNLSRQQLQEVDLLFGYNLSVKGYYYKKIQHLVEKFIFVDLGIMLKFGAPGQTERQQTKLRFQG